MEVSSIEAELKTTRELYSELQREIDRRKLNLTNQIEEESLVVIELKNKELLIKELGQKVE